MVKKIAVKKLLVAGSRLVHTGLRDGCKWFHNNKLLFLKHLCNGQAQKLFAAQAYQYQRDTLQKKCKVQ